MPEDYIPILGLGCWKYFQNFYHWVVQATQPLPSTIQVEHINEKLASPQSLRTATFFFFHKNHSIEVHFNAKYQHNKYNKISDKFNLRKDWSHYISSEHSNLASWWVFHNTFLFHSSRLVEKWRVSVLWNAGGLFNLKLIQKVFIGI